MYFHKVTITVTDVLKINIPPKETTLEYNETTKKFPFAEYCRIYGVLMKGSNKYNDLWQYRSGTVNSNMVNWNIHLIQSFFEIFDRFLSFHVYNAWLIQTWLIQSSTNLK